MNPMDVRTLHLLVHPGCTLGYGDDTWPKERTKYEKVLADQIDRARNMKDDELMLLLLYTEDPNISDLKEELKNENGRAWVRHVKSLREILARRLSVLYSLDIGKKSNADRVHQLLTRNGHVLDPSTLQLEIYGEYIGLCVEECGKCLRNLLSLQRRPIIRVPLCWSVCDRTPITAEIIRERVIESDGDAEQMKNFDYDFENRDEK